MPRIHWTSSENKEFGIVQNFCLFLPIISLGLQLNTLSCCMLLNITVQ